MGYCDFNPRLFKPFTSIKTKIVPAMADDWEMIPEQYVKIGGFSLYSKKLNQEVADIGLTRFLKFSKEQGLVIDSLKLKGNFIVGNDRSVYTEEMFNKWKNKFDVRTSVILEKKDLIPGHLYKTPCGAEILYLGTYYISKNKTERQWVPNKNNKYSGDWENVVVGSTKITKKSLMFGGFDVKDINTQQYGTGIKVLNQKCSKDLGELYTKEQIKDFLDKNIKGRFSDYFHFSETKDSENLVTKKSKED